jgi:hypothetical protein
VSFSLWTMLEWLMAISNIVEKVLGVTF